LKKAQIDLFSNSGVSFPSVRICNTAIMGCIYAFMKKAPMGNTSYKIFDLEMLLFLYVLFSFLSWKQM